MASEFYDVAGFLSGKTSLKDIELPLLKNNLSGKKVLHLQCHFGLDTLSLARLGAEVTGIDLSDKAIAAARDLAIKSDLSARFIQSDVYALEEVLDERFDVIFTSYGALPWLNDLNKWAGLIRNFLRPSGVFIMAEFHPVLWMFDDDFQQLNYSYFNKGPIQESETGTYADPEAAITQEYVCWNHGLGEVFDSLLKNDLQIDGFHEYDYSPYNCFKGLRETAAGKYQIKGYEGILPMVYTLKASRTKNL
ncbi:class I SAM-dependent methyltransferase [Robertkochia aurantiaca]|uniref:class I SAM-dependent methyltransferase n=1 Tax=Robertkochia aurantiaca TaxID=2873700 RepID=UPI001CCA7F90|nr:class I SAM-dependent methyltransferase [Robertkochia sp. 3YJGBD-33]